MKTQKLTFDQLHQDLEVLDSKNLNGIKGGQQDVTYNGGTLQEVTIVGNKPSSNDNFFNFMNFNRYNNYNDSSNLLSSWGFNEGSYGGESSSNNFDWGTAFQNLGAYSGISEIGAHGAFNLKAAEAFGKLGIIATVGGVTLDAYDLINYYQNNQGNMDVVRFSIKTGSSAWGFIEAGMVGGPEGVLIGGLAACGSWTFEQMYNALQTWIQRVSQGSADFENAISRGWIPGYN